MSAETLEREFPVPEEAMAYFRAGVSMHRSGLLDPAAQQYQHFLERVRGPAAFAGHWNRADCLHMLGQFEEALGQFDRALALQPSHPEVLAGKALALAALGRAAESVGLLEQLPDEPRYRRFLAFALYDAGERGRAADLFLRLPDLDPPAAATAAVGLLDTGRDASAMLARAHSESGELLAQVGIILARGGRVAEAQPFLRESLERGAPHLARQVVLEFLQGPAPSDPWQHARRTPLGPVCEGGLQLDPLCRHVVFLDGSTLFCDGKPHPLGTEDADEPLVSWLGDWAVGVERRGERFYVVTSRHPELGPLEDMPVLRFSRDGRLAALEADRRLYLDGRLTLEAERIKDFVFSPDGSRWAALVGAPGGERICLDGEMLPLQPAIAVDWLAFSPDARRFAYVVVEEGGQRVVLDGQPGALYDGVAGLVFSGDGERFVHWAERGGRCTAVRDGEETGWYEDAGEYTLDRSGGRFVHHAVVAGAKRLVDNGQPSSGYEDVYEIRVAPDGSSCAAFVQLRGRWHCLQDGVLSQPWEDVATGSLTWSPVRREWCYAAMSEQGEWHMVEGDRPGRGYEALARGRAMITPAGLVVHGAAQDGRWLLVLDGRESPPFGLLVGSPRLEGSLVRAIVSEGETFERYEIDSEVFRATCA